MSTDPHPPRRRLAAERAEIEARQNRGDPVMFDEIPESVRYKVFHRLFHELLETRSERWMERLRAGLGRAGLSKFDPSTGQTYAWDFLRSCSVVDFLSAIEAAIDEAKNRLEQRPVRDHRDHAALATGRVAGLAAGSSAR